MRSWLRIVENSSARLFAAAVHVVVLFVSARELGPAGQGTLVAAVTWAALFAAFAGLSLGPISHQRVAGRETAVWLPELAGTMGVLALGSTSVAYGLMLLGTRLGDDGLFRGIPASFIALAGLSVPLLVLEEYGRNLLAAARELRSYAVAQLAGSCVRLVLVIAAVGPLDLGGAGVLIGTAVGQLITVAMQCRALWLAAGKRLRPERSELKALMGGALRLHANTIAAFLLGQANVLLLNQFASKRDVGFYQLAFQMINALLLVPQAGAMVIYAKLAELGPNGVWPFQKRLMLQVLLVVSLLGALSAWLAPLLITTVAGAEFAPAAEIFRWLLLGLLAPSAAELMAPQWYGRGIFATSAVLTCLSAAINIGLNILLIPRHGVMGAVFGTVACYLLFGVSCQLVFAFWCEAKAKVGAAGPQPLPLRTPLEDGRSH